MPALAAGGAAALAFGVSTTSCSPGSLARRRRSGTVAGFSLYTLGARHDIAITAVLVSLFGAVAAVLGRVVLKERLSAVQVAGVATIVAGVAALGLAAP